MTDMTLGELLTGLVDDAQLEEFASLKVRSISQDNRKVLDGSLFIAAQGFNTHGLVYAESAVARGAVAVIWDGECDGSQSILDQVSNKVACMHCDDLREKLGEIAARFYGDPTTDLNVIGITGTDGKTSIAHFLAQAFDDHDVHCGIMGTLGNGFINDLHPTGLTTVDALQVQSTLAQIRNEGAHHAVMEVSSHGLDQGRVNAVRFNTAVFSNLAQDHLDYHGNLDAYADAKRKLFFMPGLQAAVLNLDDKFGRELAKQCASRIGVWGYSCEPDISGLLEYTPLIVHPRKVNCDSNGLHIEMETPKGRAMIDVPLLGRFNISNMLAVMSALLVSGVDFEDACKRIQGIRPVSGRMQIVDDAGEDQPSIIIDYAHTPQALEAACSSVRMHFKSKLWCVFGCGGDRDTGKRPLMAKAAEQYADRLIVTSDNPRHEDPAKIIEQVVSGFSEPDRYMVEPDRRLAIRHAISMAAPEDVVLIAGKGHESSQIIGDVHIAFNDYRVALEVMEADT